MEKRHTPLRPTLRHVLPRVLLCVLLCALPARLSAAVNALAPLSPGNVMAAAGSASAEASVRIDSYGSAEARTVTYSLYYTDTGETVGPVTVTLDTPVEPYGTGQLPVKLHPRERTGKTDVVLTLSHVNGQYNEVTINYDYITLYSVTSVPRKRVVVEDYTGMWCQYCPRGIAIMESLQRLHPDDFIGIAIHVGDKLETHAYDYETRQHWATSYPTLWCNRREKINSFDGLSETAAELSRPALMEVDARAEWDDALDAVTVTAGVTPCMETDGGYALAYVLTADGLQDDSWYQANAPGYWDDVANAPDELAFFNKGGSYILGPDITFNHVAIAELGAGGGVEGSLAGGFTPGVRKTHTAVFSGLSRNAFIQDKSRLSVCTLLLDTSTGRIENAAKCAVTSKPTSLAPARAAGHAPATVWYSPDGRRFSAPARGVNIAVRPDGTAVKTVVK